MENRQDRANGSSSGNSHHNPRLVHDNFASTLRRKSTGHTPNQHHTTTTPSPAVRSSSSMHTPDSSIRSPITRPMWRHPGVTVVRGSPQPLSQRRSPARFLSSNGKMKSSSSAAACSAPSDTSSTGLRTPYMGSSKKRKSIEANTNTFPASKSSTQKKAARKGRVRSKRTTSTQTTLSFLYDGSGAIQIHRRAKKTVTVCDAIKRTRDLLQAELSKRMAIRKKRDSDVAQELSPSTGDAEAPVSATKESDALSGTDDETNDVRALNESLCWMEAELKAAQEHVLCLGDSVNSWSAMSEGVAKRAAEQALMASLKRGMLVTKLNMRGHALGGGRKYCHRILRLDGTNIVWHAPRDGIGASDVRISAMESGRHIAIGDVVELQFGKTSGVYREVVSKSGEECDDARELASRSLSIVSQLRSLDLVFADPAEAIGVFLAVQRAIPSPRSRDARQKWRRTREQLQWQCGQLAIEGMQKRRASSASPFAASNVHIDESDEEDFSRLVPLFKSVQRDVRAAAVSRDAFRAELRKHKDAIHTLPLPASNERIRRIVSEVQYRKDLIRESGLCVNSVFHPLASSGPNYDACVRALCDALRGVEIVSAPLGRSPAKRMKRRRRESHDVAHILPEVLRSASRTLTDGDAFSVIHRCFSVPRSVLITPSGPQIPISVMISHDAIVTVQSKSSFNAVHLSRDPRTKPAVWATIETTVVENISFDESGTPSRVRHLIMRL